MICLAAYGKGERAAAAPAQRLSVQGPRRDRRRGGARGPPLPRAACAGGAAPPEPPCPGGVSVGPEPGAGRRCPGREDAPLALLRALAVARRPRVPPVGSAAPCLHGRKSRSLLDT